MNEQKLPFKLVGLMGYVLQMFGNMNGGAIVSNPNTPNSPRGGI